MQSGIDSADNFIFILSPDSVVSDPCMQELAHAITNGKRLIPICYRKPEQATVPVALSPINYIFINETVKFDAALTTLVAAMHTDLDWVRSHTRLQVRALEWQAKSSDGSYLLGGSDLREAEAWRGRSASQPIKPTELQTQYIAASRAAATRSQRRNLTIATVVAVVASALAIVAVIQYFRAKRETVKADNATKTAVAQRQEADRQRDIATEQRAEADRQRDAAEHETRIATSGRLAATAIGLKDSQFDVASLLGIEAGRVEPTFDSLNAQVTLFESSPDLITYLHQPGGQGGFVDSITFSPDGKRFATATDQGVIVLWDARTRRPLTTLPKQPNVEQVYLRQIAFSPDGATLAVVYFYAGAQLWNVGGAKPVLMNAAPPAQPGHPYCVAFHPTGKLLAVGGANGVQVWSFPEMRALRTLRGAASDAASVYGLAFSPKDRLLLAYTQGDSIHFENAVTAKPRGEIKLPPVKVESSFQSLLGNTSPGQFGTLAFGADGSQLAAEDGTGIGVWSVQSGSETVSASSRGTLPVGDAGIEAGIEFRPDGKELVTISSLGALRKWDVKSLKLLREYPSTMTGDLRAVAFTSDGKQFLTGLNSGITLVWSDEDTTLRNVAQSEYPELPASPFGDNMPDALLGSVPEIIAVSASGTAARITPRGVEARNHGRVVVLPGSPPLATQLAISNDGRFVAASSTNGNGQSRRLWDISQAVPRAVPLQGNDSGTFALAFSPSGDLLATGGAGGIFLWDVKTGKLMGENVEPKRRPVRNIAFSPDSTLIAMSLDGGETLLAHAATQQLLGMHLVAGSDGGWFGTPSTVAFSQDRRSLFIRKGDGTVLKWDADPKDWIARACSVAGRNLSLDEWRRYIGDTIPYHRTCPQFPDGEGLAK